MLFRCTRRGQTAGQVAQPRRRVRWRGPDGGSGGEGQ